MGISNLTAKLLLCLLLVVAQLACWSCDRSKVHTPSEVPTTTRSAPKQEAAKTVPVLLPDIDGIRSKGLEYVMSAYSLKTRQDLIRKVLPDNVIERDGTQHTQSYWQYQRQSAPGVACNLIILDSTNLDAASFDIPWFAAEHRTTTSAIRDEFMALHKLHQGVVKNTKDGGEQWIFDVDGIRVTMATRNVDKPDWVGNYDNIVIMCLPPGTPPLKPSAGDNATQ
jgi:hypothetical protein